MQIRYTKVNPDATEPRLMTEGAAAADIWAASMDAPEILGDGRYLWTYRTGLAFEVPAGVAMLFLARSSVVKTGGILANSVGLIDTDYRGEVFVKFYTHTPAPPYWPGNRIGQVLFVPFFAPEFVHTTDLSTTARGTGGFGSTGK